ncbi:MAG: hypothetical protein H7323_09345 [Frankiales bacterium]|nr:hypothetical protein [Frankiales bacterium]
MLVIESSSAQQVRTALDGALGAGTDQALPDCGPSVVLRGYPGLQVVLQGDRFVGWSTRPGSTLQTVDGIGLGSTLAQLRAAAPSVTVTQATLGREFSVPGGYFGILAGSGETATVTTIATGIACAAR